MTGFFHLFEALRDVMDTQPAPSRRGGIHLSSIPVKPGADAVPPPMDSRAALP